MAYRNICGFETGDASESNITFGTFSIQSSIKRTGTYAVRCNPTTTGRGWVNLKALAADGSAVNLVTEHIYWTFYFYAATLPSANDEDIANVEGWSRVGLRITSGGILKIYADNSGAKTLIETGTTTLSTGTWYRIDWHQQMDDAGSVYEVKVNGAVELSGTADIAAGGSDIIEITVGKRHNQNGETVDFYYDDIAISDSAYPGAGEVHNMVPDASGSFGWATGTFADADEIPHDSDTTHLTETFSSALLNLKSASSAGVVGDIGAVKAWSVARGETDGDGEWGLLARSASTNNSTVNLFISSTYGFYAKLWEDNFADSNPWEEADLDALQTGMNGGTSGKTQRVTATGAMVWSTGATPVLITPGVLALILSEKISSIPPRYNQSAFRFRNDDGSLAAPP